MAAPLVRKLPTTRAHGGVHDETRRLHLRLVSMFPASAGLQHVTGWVEMRD